ncbi:MAG: MlaD family protein [Verrucomicrobiota bacterium]
MGTERKSRTEILVGLFLFIGLSILGVLVVTFGRLGQGLDSPYDLTVLFQNANGLATGADVLLSGAKIGFLTNNPQLVGDKYEVALHLKIQGTTRIPKGSKFMVGSSNLLGDKFIDVIPMDPTGPDDFWQPGEIIKGTRSSGLDDLTARGSIVLEQLTESLKDIQNTTSNLNKYILNEANIKNLAQTFTNLKESSEAFKKTSLSIDQVVAKADTALTTADGAFKTFDAVGKDFKKVAKNAADGHGPLGVLTSDKETAENLRSLISNLRRSGVLFYKDRPAPPEEKKSR